MKIFYARYSISIPLVLVGILIAILLTYYFTPQILYFSKTYWIFTSTAALIVLTPLGNTRLISNKNEKPNKKLHVWILQIIILELSVLSIFWGICLFTEKSFFSSTMLNFYFDLGVFPWTVIALLASSFGIVSFRLCKDAYLSTTLYCILPTKPDSTFSILINSLPRVSTLLTFSSILAFYSLLIVKLIVPKLFSSLTGLSIISILFFFIYIFTSSRFVKHKIYQFTINFRLPLIIRICSLLLTLTSLITIFSLFLGNQNIPAEKINQFSSSSLLNWNLFAFCWWISLIPITGVFIAKLSRGYSVRSIILIVCIPPLLLSKITNYLPLQNIPQSSAILIAIIGLTLFLLIVTPDYEFDSLMQTYLPANNRKKYRAVDRFLSTLLQFSGLVICLFLATKKNILFITLLFFAFTFPLSLILLFLPIAIIKILRNNYS